MISRKMITLWSWEIFMLPFVTNQAIIYYHSDPLALALSLVAISMLLPHLMLFTWHHCKIGHAIPDLATGKAIQRGSNVSYLACLNIIFDFTVHFFVFLHIACNYVVTNDGELKQEHLYSYRYFIFDFLIPLLFIEIVFDFFYYWWHYYGHKNQWLWKFVHNKHHEVKYPVYWDFYHNHFCDMLFVRLVPFTLYYVFSLSTSRLSTMVLVQHYIVIAELLGHAGFSVSKGDDGDGGGVSRCISNMIGITLNAVDHDYHHQKCGTNYGKRLSLWDKLFGTYYNPKRIKRNTHQTF